MKILFLCTHNRCRSILAEAITNQLSDGRIEARSAGSQPAGEVHPLSLKYLREAAIDCDYLRSKSWDECSSWSPDFIVTVCDSAAAESCPLWMDATPRVHWGLADPSQLTAQPEQVALAFRSTINILQQRISTLLQRNFETLDEATQLKEMSEFSFG